MDPQQDFDKPLSSFGGSSREWRDAASPSFNEVDSSEEARESVEFRPTPVLRESLASPEFDMSVGKENLVTPQDDLRVDMAMRSPGLRSDDDGPALVTPNTDQHAPSPSFDLALPIPPIASLTPDVAADSPAQPMRPQVTPDSCTQRAEEEDAKVSFAPRDSTPRESIGMAQARGRDPPLGSPHLAPSTLPTLSNRICG